MSSGLSGLTFPLRLIETVVCIAGEYVQVVMKRVLVASRFIVLASGDTVGVVCLLHCDRNLLGSIKNMVPDFLGKFVDILVMGVGNNHHMTGVLADEKGVDKTPKRIRLGTRNHFPQSVCRASLGS